MSSGAQAGSDLDTKVRAVGEWLVAAALGEVDDAQLFQGFCRRLHEAGLPLLRVHITIRTVHPLIGSVDLTWWRDRALESGERMHGPAVPLRWRQSPLFWMLEHRKLELRCRLDASDSDSDFPVFEDFRRVGATDYLALVTAFGTHDAAFEQHDGIATSWLTDREGGFREAELQALRRVQLPLALVAKLSKREHTAMNVATAYLGADAGRRVLEGQIRLGDVEQIPAVIWYSDLRGSTAMADGMPAREFLKDLNAYFHCTAGAVLDHGGEVLRFIGDAVLAVFPLAGGDTPTEVAATALQAARAAGTRLENLNAAREARGEAPLAYGLGLHVGEVLYGNIGVPGRIEFSVVGNAANEVCRLQDLCKVLDEPLLVSKAFAEQLSIEWRVLGRYNLRGIDTEQEVFAPRACR